MKILNCKQGSPEWYMARCGKITASMFGDCIKKVNDLDDRQSLFVRLVRDGISQKDAATQAGYKTIPSSEKIKAAIEGKDVGDYSDKAKAYAFRLACERISGQLLDEEQFETYSMRRGREFERVARYVHEQRIGQNVEQVGFIATDDDLFGASLDGIIGEDGAAEYKCFISPSSLMPILLNDDISDIEHQAQGGLWISGRQWIDVCLYCPSLYDVDLDFSSFRVQRNDNFIEQMELELLKFNDLVDSYIHKLKSKRGFS